MIGTSVQHYRIVRQLGAGGMGVVYEAEDTRLGRHVALKFLPETHTPGSEGVERFLREARIASSLNHSNICTIYDVGIHEGRHFIAMELLEGESLRSRIHGHPLPVDQILEVGCQLADALEAAHAKGIVHRDIKPANVFLTKRGQAKLLDFGIAKLGDDRKVDDATSETRVAGDALTSPGMAMGSITYMSPEQARGEELDGRTDLFSLGLVLYEMATGREAFEGKTTAVVFDAILNRQPPDPRLMNPLVPEELQRVILRALEKDRRMRFQTAADMLAELGRMRRDSTARVTAAGTPASGSTPVAATKPTLPMAGVIAVAAVLIAAAAGVYYFVFRQAAPQLTEKDTVIVADFVNTTGDAVFDDALKQAVSVQLQQTPFLTLMPDARVQRTLRLMQKPPETAVTGDVVREVCQRAGAKATIEGSIGSLGSAYVITIGAHNCQTGESLGQQQGQASSKEEVLGQIGTVVKALRQHLGESLATIQKYDVPVTEATTSSLEALRAYGQGLRARATKGDEASIPLFRQAVDRDPNFALAYAKLGVVLGNIGQADDAAAMATKAYELRDKVSEYERLYINWNYASRVLKDQKKVRESLEILTAAYPRDFAARNNFGVYYNNEAQIEEALKQYLAASEIAPDEPGPIANTAYVYLQLGRHEEAFQAVDRVLALRPDGFLATARWVFAVINGDPRATQFEQVARKLSPPDSNAQTEASLAAWFGKFRTYETLENELIARMKAGGNTTGAANLEATKVITLALYRRGKDLDALKAAAAAEKNPALLAQLAVSLAVMGEIDSFRSAMQRLERDPKASALIGPMTVGRAYLQFLQGKTAEAIAAIQAFIATQPRARDLNYFIAEFREKSGDTDAAIAGYRSVIDAMTFLGLNPVITGSRLKLAKLYLDRNDTKNAAEQIDALLKQWKDAEGEFAALTQAKEMRAKIK